MSASNHYKRPRHYAAEIIPLKTLTERREALTRVPVEWREWVAFYVKDFFAKRKLSKRRRYA